jgi:response regulator RpfG family c-di-GMP phosphodiesterase
MERLYDYEKCAILYVDDEEKSLKYFTRAFGDKFKILSAGNASEGYRLLEQHRDGIALLITDQRMPGEKGVEFLERAQRLHPNDSYSDYGVLRLRCGYRRSQLVCDFQIRDQALGYSSA